MSNLAAAAAKLQRKDAERTVLLDEIKSYDDLLASNFFGKLVVTVLEGGATRGTIDCSVLESARKEPCILQDKVRIGSV